MAGTTKKGGVKTPAADLLILTEQANFPGFGLLPLNTGLLLEVYDDWNEQKYFYGGKSEGITTHARANNPKPVDCSGFFGMALDLATVVWARPGLSVGTDLHNLGSWQQWQKLKGYRTPTGLKLKPTKQFAERDGVVRAFYLPPNRTASGIGHIGFVLDGLTVESCGSLGVCRRPWNPRVYRWMKNCDGFVLSVPGTFGVPE